MTTNTAIDIQADTTEWSGLLDSNYLVVPRTLLQSMPEAWQRDLIARLEELQDAFAHIEQAECYKVEPAVEREVGGLSAEQLKSIGYSKGGNVCDCYATRLPDGSTEHVPPVCPHETSYYDNRGNEIDYDQLVAWPIRTDPVPHYNRGRTHIEPNLT